LIQLAYRYSILLRNRNKEISLINENIEEDEVYLKSLGIHEVNIYYFLKGSYEERAQYIAGPRRMVSLRLITFLLLLAGTVVSLIYALDEWVDGYIIFGLGVFLSIILLIDTIVSRQKRREDPLLIKTKKCINYSILKSTEFLLEEFSKNRFEKELVNEFIFFHSKGIEMDYEEIQEIIANYSLDDPEEEIMAIYLKDLKNPIIEPELEFDDVEI